MSVDGNSWLVYCHTNKTNGKKYIGITSGSLRKRFGVEGNGYVKSRYFYQAIKKYGWDGFSHEVLCSGLTREEASMIERDYIAKWETTNRSKGYNIRSGGFESKELSPEGLLAQIASHSGPTSPAAVPVVSFSLDGQRLWDFSFIQAACEFYGVSDSAIWSALKSENKTAAGVLFRYAKDVEGIEQYSEEYLNEHVRVRHYKAGHHAKCTEVVLFDSEGIRDSEFPSMKDAAKFLGVYHGSISGAIRGHHVSVKGYFVRLKSEVGDSLSIPTDGLYSARNIRVLQLDEGGRVLFSYSSLRQAAIAVDGDHKRIKNACINGKKYRGFYWKSPALGGAQ